MATHANSTPAPSPHRALSLAEGAALSGIGGAVGRPAAGLIPAFSRRQAIFGTVAVAAVPAAILRESTADLGTAMTADARLSAIAATNDARLAAIADRFVALQAEVDAYSGDDDGFRAVDDQFFPLMQEMEDTPADTLDGVFHKIRATDVPGVGNDGEAHDIMCSICEDIIRLHAAGMIRAAGAVSLTGGQHG